MTSTDVGIIIAWVVMSVAVLMVSGTMAMAMFAIFAVWWEGSSIMMRRERRKEQQRCPACQGQSAAVLLTPDEESLLCWGHTSRLKNIRRLEQELDRELGADAGRYRVRRPETHGEGCECGGH